MRARPTAFALLPGCLLLGCLLLPLSLRAAPGLPEVERARGLLASGEVLEATLLLRQIVEEGEPSARALARYHLGLVREQADDCEGALEWLGPAADELADGALRLDACFRVGACEARLGRPERALREVARRLGQVRAAWGDEAPDAEIALRALLLALPAGHPEWVPVWTGVDEAQALERALSGLPPTRAAALLDLPGLPAAVRVRLSDALAGAGGLGSLVDAALAAGGPGPADDLLRRVAPGLFAPTRGAIVVPVPLSGPQAVFGQAVQRTLAALPATSGAPAPGAPWRFVDSAQPGWVDEVVRLAEAREITAMLGPMGATSWAALEPALARLPLPVLPLYPAVADRTPAFPVVPWIYDDQDEVRALFARLPLPAGARVALLVGESWAARGLADVVEAEAASVGASLALVLDLSADPKAQGAASETWARRVSAAACDHLLLATGPADALRALSLLAYRGVAPAASPACVAPEEGTRCVHVLALRTVEGPGFRDPVTHLSDGAWLASPCPAEGARGRALDEALGRPAFLLERVVAHLGQALVEARAEGADASALALARRLHADRRWAGVCGLLEVQGGRGRWPYRVVPFQSEPVPEPEPGSGAAPGEPGGGEPAAAATAPAPPGSAPPVPGSAAGEGSAPP